jgi:hypothetical protein
MRDDAIVPLRDISPHPLVVLTSGGYSMDMQVSG